jgi:hypothetical protein
MNSTTPQIGFDRFIQLDWAASALRVRAGLGSIESFIEILDNAGLSVAAKKKTRTVLNRLWLDPRPALVEFSDRGAAIFKTCPETSIAALSWGMAIATYPFFGKVAELVGRLSALQGDCTSAEVHRRMSETYGEREGTYRMTNMVLQSQANWGAIERVDKNKRLVRRPSVTLTNDQLVSWLIEAVLRYTSKTVSVSALKSMAVIYPFVLDQPLAYVVSNSPTLELRSEGTLNQFVALRELI